MATIVRNSQDKYVKLIKKALDKYERAYPGSKATLYRQNSVSVRVRILDPRFADWSKARRYDDVAAFLARELDEDTLQEISVLLTLTSNELKSSLANLDFENPLPSRL